MATLKERIGQHQFSVLISIADDDLFDVGSHRLIKRFNSSRNPLSIHPVVIVADPFLFVHNEELYLFYEEQTGLTGKGIIKMSKTKDNIKWTKPTIVLEEGYHLSYPNVFKCDGQIYMIPETGNEGKVILYKPNSDLTRWRHYKTLLNGRRFTDSSLLKHENLFYLFTTDYSNKTNILRLYLSDSIDGVWTEHSRSPIASGKDTGRCAGALINHKGKLYRPSQLTRKRYGEGVDIFEIAALSDKEYREEWLKTIIPNPNKNYQRGGHHFNYCTFKNKLMVATDAFCIKINYFEIARRVVVKIRS
ncbi:MAG: hypothetical protein HGA35_06555 [Erysipelotrichaceae bacterium]|nr:hypothetical protein [Erysipelotrichaceae bacterium]